MEVDVEKEIEGIIEKISKMPMAIKRKVRNKFIAMSRELEKKKYEEEGGVAFIDRLTGRPVSSKMDWEDERDRVLKSAREKLK